MLWAVVIHTTSKNDNSVSVSWWLCLLLSLSLQFVHRCFECNEELSTHCNKKALAQTLDFLQKHSVKAASGNTFNTWQGQPLNERWYILGIFMCRLREQQATTWNEKGWVNSATPHMELLQLTLLFKLKYWRFLALTKALDWMKSWRIE